MTGCSDGVYVDLNASGLCEDYTLCLQLSCQVGPLFCLSCCSESVGRPANLVMPACWRMAEWLSCLTLCGPPPGMVGLLS